MKEVLFSDNVDIEVALKVKMSFGFIILFFFNTKCIYKILI